MVSVPSSDCVGDVSWIMPAAVMMITAEASTIEPFECVYSEWMHKHYDQVYSLLIAELGRG